MSDVFSDATLLDLVDHIYVASGDPAQWASFGVRIQREVPGVGFGALLLIDNAHTVGTSVLVGYDPDSLRSFYDHYQYMNPYEALFKGVPVGKVVKATDITTSDWLKQQTFYHEWLKPAGNFTHGACVIVSRDQRRLMRVNFDIPDTLGRLEEPCAQLLSRLRPHFARAFEVSERLESVVATQGMLEGILNRVDGGAAILGAGGLIIAINTHAESLARAGTVLRVRSGRLGFVRSDDETAFRRALAAALDPFAGEGPCSFTVRLGATRNGHVVVLPLRAGRTTMGTPAAGPQALMVVREAGVTATPMHLLREFYGLTAAEGAVVQRIATGESPKEIGLATGVSFTTVRNQLAAAMAKMDVHRQAELVAVLADLTPRLTVDRQG